MATDWGFNNRDLSHGKELRSTALCGRCIPEDRDLARETLQRDVEHFLSCGGSIDYLDSDLSNTYRDLQIEHLCTTH